MADRLLVLVPHEQTHAPRSILEQARKLGPDFTEMRAIKHTMELIAHSLCIANGAPAKVARDRWPGKTALLNWQSMGTKSELHKSPELTDAPRQLIVELFRERFNLSGQPALAYEDTSWSESLAKLRMAARH